MYFTTFVKERFWLIVFFLALVYFVFLIRSDLVRKGALDAEKGAIMIDLADETARQAGLRNELKLLNKSSYVEILAREKLGFVRRGEDPYKVIVK